MSQSGWAAAVEYRDTHNLTFAETSKTGSHQASARAVADGMADLAAIDAVTWALLADDPPLAAALRILDRTRPTPALPFIAGPNADAALICIALAQAIAALAPDDRAALHLTGLAQIPAAQYLAEPQPPAP